MITESSVSVVLLVASSSHSELGLTQGMKKEPEVVKLENP